MADPALVIDHANRFEAVATDGFEGRPYRAALGALADRVKADPAGTLAPAVARALCIMATLIEEGDRNGRFAAKVAILREAAALLRADGQLGAPSTPP